MLCWWARSENKNIYLDIGGLAEAKIKICFVCPKCYPLFDDGCKAIFGGAEVDLYLIGNELAKDPDFEVSYVNADYGQREVIEHGKIKLYKGFSFEDLPFISAYKLWKTLKAVDADIYMMKTASIGIPLVYLYCKLNDKKFFYKTASNTECDGTYQKKHPVIGRAFNYVLRHADKVICQNKDDMQQLKQNCNIHSQVIANAHAVDEVECEKDGSILWVGRSAAVKQPEQFLRLAKKFASLKFVMICQKATGDNNYDQLKDNAARISNLNFLESVNFKEIDSYFAKANLFVNTSKTEGFPNTFIQACKAGTPILTLNVNPDNFLDAQHVGRCGNGSWERFTEMFVQLQSHDLQQQLGENARKYAREHHDIKIIIEDYKKLFFLARKK